MQPSFHHRRKSPTVQSSKQTTMKYSPNTLYHIYNQGNNQQIIFPQKRNYLYFLEKVRKELLPVADIIAYCLMPNHFHFLVYTNEISCTEVFNKTTGERNFCQQVISKQLGILLSSYTRAINKQEGRTGALFRPSTKRKECFYEGWKTVNGKLENQYAQNCLHYIHNNPQKAKIVTQPTDWPFSSARDYAGLREGTLCNQSLAKQLELIS